MLLNYVPRASGLMRIGRDILTSRTGASSRICASAGWPSTSPRAAPQSLGEGPKRKFLTRRVAGPKKQ